MEWIKCSDRLPDEEYEQYLVWNTANVNELEIQVFIKPRFTSKVTHWMPLPTPPKD